MKKVIVVGGGAAGFFAAINAAEVHPDYEIIILEKSPKLLEKVRISGGGRCNVTHACFDPKELCKYYPRGEKELLGPFHRFFTSHTIQWFESRGVKIIAEQDGRMFPITNDSQTIIDCFLKEARSKNITIKTECGVESIRKERRWHLQTTKQQTLEADAIILTTGNGAKMWNVLKELGHTIVPPVPSLFTFNIKDERIKDLEGISLDKAIVRVVNTKLETTGALLITHWGMSGPAILKLSAWGARELFERKHQFEIIVNWTGEKNLNKAKEFFLSFKADHPKKNVFVNPLFGIPSRLWKKLVLFSGIKEQENFADLSNLKSEMLLKTLTESVFKVTGKSTNKDEFVTAGGVDLKEVDFKTMESKLHPNLYFAGEVLNMDAVTGGFNFQAAWTTAYIAAQSI